MISSNRELIELVNRARKNDSVALDTEFIWERTFYPRLGLIQLALSDEECFLIDPLAIEDLTPLGALLADKTVVKILHDAPQDLTILSRVTKSSPANIFDTRLAAGFTGLPSTISLANLINVLLDIDLPKNQTRTNWLHRPLDPKQIAYALDDVRYLRAVRILLLTRIVVPEIKKWLQDELAMLNTPETYIESQEYNNYYRKISGAGSLAPRQLAVLRELAVWREKEARKLDRPRGHVITDKTLLMIAKSELQTIKDLVDAQLLSSKKQRQFGSSILEAILAGNAIPESDHPVIERPIRLNAREKRVFSRLTDFVQLKCDMQGIDTQLIGTTAELKQLSRNLNNPGSPLPKRLTDGWRRNFLEEFFRQRF